MLKQLWVLALAAIVAGCAGQYASTDHYTNGAEASPMEREHDSGASFSTRLIEVSRCAPDRGSVCEELPIEIKITALENLSDVIIRDTISSHVTVVRTDPPAEVQGGLIVWRFDTMDCGECRTLRAWVQTEQVGDIVDCVTAAALPRLCVSTYIGQCHICIDKTGPETLCLGESGYYTITVANDGSSEAHDVVVTDVIPEGLSHESGDSKISWKIGELPSGCSERMSICLEAAKTGSHCNQAIVTASNAPEAVAEACTLVVEANIDVTLSGTHEQFIGKEAEYTITVTNTGDTQLDNICVTDEVSPYTSFVNDGGGNVSGNSVSWTVDQLGPGESKSWNIVLSNCTPTDCDNSLHATACSEVCGNVEDCDDCTTIWKGHPGLMIEMVDVCDPMLVGEDGCYRIRVTNQGSGADQDITIVATFPAQLEPTDVSGTTQGEIAGQTVTFDAFPRLNPGESIEYSIGARAVKAGDARVSVELGSRMLQTPVTEEESTYVY